MGLTNFPHGVSSFGVPLFPASNEDMLVGNAYWVGATAGASWIAGNDAPDCGTKDRPFATLDYALSKCTASNGDIIYILPYHSETITGAGGITLDVAGVRIKGIGRYDARPRFLMDGGTSVTMLVTAANCSIENVVFAAGHADIVVFGTITAKGMRFLNCHFEENTTSENWLIGPSVGAADNDADGFEFIGNTWNGASAGANVIIINKNQNDVRIIGNVICGDFSVSPYSAIYAPDTEVMKNILVADNIIRNDHDANNTPTIAIANTASTGAIVRNLVGAQDASSETNVLAGAAGLFVAENYCSGIMGTASGYLYPTADS
jgi:hypothetical protein